MIVYIEGVDGSGKSTLADKIAKMCEKEKFIYNRYAERDIPTKPLALNRMKFEELVVKFNQMANDSVLHIMDRGPISDCIYRMFDNYEPVGKLEDYIAMFDGCKNNLMIVYARTKKAEEMMRKRGDDNPIAMSRHKELSKAYDLIMGIVNTYLNKKIIPFDFSKRNATNFIIDCTKSLMYGKRKTNKEAK